MQNKEEIYKEIYKKDFDILSEWFKHTDLSKECFQPYNLQIANSFRILHNDIVYNFDETGSGKTIVTGMSILNYWIQWKKNNKSEFKVLLILTNAVLESNQFIEDIKSKLPIDKISDDIEIKAINNNYQNIAKEINNKYNIIVIDEAHLFINQSVNQRDESLRTENLKNLCSEKVIFLTATPLRYNSNNLNNLQNIGENIIKKESYLIRGEISKSTQVFQNLNHRVCQEFDILQPYSRYFKDTIKTLQINDNKKSFAIRKAPELWKIEKEENKIEKVAEKINNLIGKKEKDEELVNRAIVFVKYIEKEAEQIADALKKKGFKEFSFDSYYTKTYLVIHAETKNLLNKINETKTPDVLIIISNIGEQSLNLPFYNWVINYNIPNVPASIEQRWGRIDRMSGSKYKYINMSFVLYCDWKNDTYFRNYYCALVNYAYSFLSIIPSKNILITKESFDFFTNYTEEVIEFSYNSYANEIKKAKLKNSDNASSDKKYYICFENINGDIIEDNDNIIEFFENAGISLSNLSFDTDLEEKKNEMLNYLNQQKKLLNQRDKLELFEELAKNNELFDGILYNSSFDLISPEIRILRSNDLNIKENSNYRLFDQQKDILMNYINTFATFEKFKDVFETFYENKFKDDNSDWNLIFPDNEHYKLLNGIVNNYQCDQVYDRIIKKIFKDCPTSYSDDKYWKKLEEDSYLNDNFFNILRDEEQEEQITQIKENFNELHKHLKFFKMVSDYQNILLNGKKYTLYTDNGKKRQKYELNPLKYTFRDLKELGTYDDILKNISNTNKNAELKNFRIYKKDTNNEGVSNLKVSNWLKLFFYISHKFKDCKIKDTKTESNIIVRTWSYTIDDISMTNSGIVRDWIYTIDDINLCRPVQDYCKLKKKILRLSFIEENKCKDVYSTGIIEYLNRILPRIKDGRI